VKKWTNNFGYFCNFQKEPKVNNHPIGEKSPNLVTLPACLTKKGDNGSAGWTFPESAQMKPSNEILVPRTSIRVTRNGAI
jgi:hypothetical protein